jgi:hypothetical protein
MTYSEAADRILMAYHRVIDAGGTKKQAEAEMKKIAERYPATVLQAAWHKLIADGLVSR